MCVFVRGFAVIAAINYTARFLIIGLFAVLSGCGGGGGGVGGGESRVVSIGVSPSSLTFTAPDASASTPWWQSVTLTVSGGTAWLGDINIYGEGIASSYYRYGGNATAEVTVHPSSPSNLSNGIHTGSVTVQVCADKYCSSDIVGSPFTINVTYVVGGLSGLPASINLNALEGESPVAVSETITNASGSSAWTSSVNYNGAITNWLTQSSSSGATLPVTMSVGATPLPPGTYTATMQVTVSGKVLNLPITYTVAKALAPSPGLLGFNIGTTVNAADLSQNVTIGTNYPVGSPKNINWNAAVDVPWLSVTTAGNSSSQPTLTATLVQAQLDQMLNGTHSGYITLSSTDANVTNVTIPVSLFIDRPQISYVSPYIASANSSAEVIIRGKKFSQLNVQNVKFGNSLASAVNVVSDTEIRATYPSLAAGQYPVSVTTSSGSVVSRATLVVTTPTTLTDLTFMNSSAIKGVIHDTERSAVLAFPLSGSFIERHTFNGSSWTSTSVTLPYTFGPVVMSPDGKEIVLLTQDSINSYIVKVDAVTLSVLSVMGPVWNRQAAAVMDDGNVLTGINMYGAFLYSLDLSSQPNSFLPIDNTNVAMPLLSINASGDGSRAILKYDNSATPASSGVYSFDAGTGQFNSFATPIAGFINNIDRTGAHILSNNTNVYNASLALLGNLPYFNDVANSCSTSAAVISQDGTRAYTFCGLSPYGRVYTYDLTAATVNGYFPAIGSYVSVTPFVINSMQISGDGKTLFLVDTAKITMVSLP